MKILSIFEEFEEKNRVLKLQNAYENGIIKEQDLSEIEKQELFQLYNEQINDLQEEIERSKVELKMYKNIISKKMERIKK